MGREIPEDILQLTGKEVFQEISILMVMNFKKHGAKIQSVSHSGAVNW